MNQWTRSTFVNAPVKEVFTYLSDPIHWMDTYPDAEISDVESTPDGLGTSFTWAGKFLGRSATAELEFTEFVPDQRIAATSAKGFVFSWTFEPDFEGTKLTLAVEDVPATWAESALDIMAMGTTGGEFDTWLSNIEAVLSGGPAEPEDHARTRRLTRSVLIAAPVEEVFTYLRDPEWFADYPGTEVSDIHVTPEGVGTSVRWTDHLLGIPVSVTHTFTEVVPNQRIVSTSSNGFHLTWTLGPEDGGTRLTVAEEATPANWAAAAVDELILKLAEKDLDPWLATIKEAVESDVG